MNIKRPGLIPRRYGCCKRLQDFFLMNYVNNFFVHRITTRPGCWLNLIFIRMSVRCDLCIELEIYFMSKVFSRMQNIFVGTIDYLDNNSDSIKVWHAWNTNNHSAYAEHIFGFWVPLRLPNLLTSLRICMHVKCIFICVLVAQIEVIKTLTTCIFIKC